MKNCAFFLLSLLILHTPLTAFPETKPLNVGVIVPLTGPVANVGECIKNAVLLAKEKEKAGSQVEFIFEDDAFKAANTVAALHKLKNQNGIGGLITFGTGTSLAAATIAESSRLPTVAMAMSEQVVADRQFVFRHYPPLQAQNAAIAMEIERRGYKKIAVVTTQQEALIRYRETFLNEFKAKVVLDEQCTPGETDFRTISAKIRSLNPDAVYLLLLPPELSILPVRLREAGYKGDYFGCATLQNPAAVKAANQALENAWFTSLDERKAAAFNQAYMDKYGAVCGLPEGVIAYESARLFITGAGKEDLRDYLSNPIGFKSDLGLYHLVPPNTYDLPVAVKKIKAGAFVQE